jgi:hypothetical protein
MSLTPKQRKHQLEISPKGGKATVAKYGVEYMRELAKKGAEKRRQKRLEQQASGPYQNLTNTIEGLKPLKEDGTDAGVEGIVSGNKPPEKKRPWFKRLLF